MRVTLSRFAYQLIFRPFIAEFGARYPHIQLELSLCDGTINILDAGDDLGIRFGDTLEEGMVARRLLPPFAEGLYAAPEYLARHGTPQTPDDLVRHRLHRLPLHHRQPPAAAHPRRRRRTARRSHANTAHLQRH